MGGAGGLSELCSKQNELHGDPFLSVSFRDPQKYEQRQDFIIINVISDSSSSSSGRSLFLCSLQ